MAGRPPAGPPAGGLLAMRDNFRLRMEQEKLSRLQELQSQARPPAYPVVAPAVPDQPVSSVRELFASRRAGSGTSVGRRIGSGGSDHGGLRRDLPNTPPLIPPIGIHNDRYAAVDMPITTARVAAPPAAAAAAATSKAPTGSARRIVPQPPPQQQQQQQLQTPAAASPRPPRAPRPQRATSAEGRGAEAEAMPDMAAVRRARASRITEESKRRLSSDGSQGQGQRRLSADGSRAAPATTTTQAPRQPPPKAPAAAAAAAAAADDLSPEELAQQQVERAAKAEAEILDRTTRAEERSRQLKERQEARKAAEAARKGGDNADGALGGWDDQPVGAGAADDRDEPPPAPMHRSKAPPASKWDDDDNNDDNNDDGNDGQQQQQQQQAPPSKAAAATPKSKPKPKPAVIAQATPSRPAPAPAPAPAPEDELPLSPRGAYNLDAILAEAEPPAVDDGSLVECDICNRRFAGERIDKHIAVCSKAANKKRKVFDPSKQRVIDAEMAKFVKDAKKVDAKYEKKLERTKGNWRYKHEEFIRALKAAKGADTSDLPPPPKDNPDYVRCDYCNRQFNETAAERHIPLCRERAAKKPAAPAPKKK